jgi:hypothetical protein
MFCCLFPVYFIISIILYIFMVCKYYMKKIEKYAPNNVVRHRDHLSPYFIADYFKNIKLNKIKEIHGEEMTQMYFI